MTFSVFLCVPSQQAPKRGRPGHNAPLCPPTYGILALMWPWKILRMNTRAKSLGIVQIQGWHPLGLMLDWLAKH